MEDNASSLGKHLQLDNRFVFSMQIVTQGAFIQEAEHVGKVYTERQFQHLALSVSFLFVCIISGSGVAVWLSSVFTAPSSIRVRCASVPLLIQIPLISKSPVRVQLAVFFLLASLSQLSWRPEKIDNTVIQLLSYLMYYALLFLESPTSPATEEAPLRSFI